MKTNLDWARNMVLAASLLAVSSILWADDRPTRFEITPFGGYRIGGSLTLDDPSYKRLDFEDSGIYGLAASMHVVTEEDDGDSEVEIMWTHQNTSLKALPNPGVTAQSLTLHVDQVHFNGLYSPPGFDQIRPYAILGLGGTHYGSPDTGNSVTLFSWAVGGGAKIPLTKHLGLRFEAKWDPALTMSSGNIFCNSATGQCYASTSGDIINQMDFTAGLSLKI